MEKKHTKRNTILGFITLLIALFIFWGVKQYKLIFSPQFQIEDEDKVYLYIDRDDTIDSIYNQLTEKAHPINLSGFKKICTYKKYSENIHTGKYEIHSDDNALTLYRKLSRGHQTPTKLVVNNPRTIEAVVGHLAKQIMVDSTEIAEQLFDETIQAEMGYDATSLLSFFIPNTYEVYWNIPVEELLSRLQKEHQAFWNTTRKEKAEKIGLTPFEVSILASIVDEETIKNDEKKKVAGLYINRLKKGMLLQADPTVKYALGDFTIQRVLEKHLTIDSPYNTYLYTGLPPGPIRIPSIQGLDAVLNYEDHNYLYMCAKDDFSGYHNFASNLAEHTRNARKYWNALNKRKIYK